MASWNESASANEAAASSEAAAQTAVERTRRLLKQLFAVRLRDEGPDREKR